MRAFVTSRHLFGCAMQSLNDLSIRSYRGDDGAARYLEAAVRHSIRVFHHLLWRPSDKLRQRMAKAVDMPGLISLEKDRIILYKRLAAHVGLGTRNGRNFQGKQATRQTGPTAAVIRMYEQLTEQHTVISHLQISPPDAQTECRRAALRLRLLPLSRKPRGTWYKAAWPLFLAIYGQSFEEHPLFREQAKSVKVKAERRARLHDPMSQAEQREAVRKLIRRQIQLAWRSIAAPDSGG